MAMSHEERLELLKIAREAKAKKRQERLENEPVKPKGRPKKMPEPVEEPVEEIVEEVVEEVVEEIVEKAPPKSKSSKKVSNAPKKSLTLPVDPVENGDDEVQEIITEYQTEVVKKPKRRIVKKIVYESNSDDEVIHEVEYKKSDKPKKIVKKDTPANPPPKEVKMKQNSATNLANMFFNY